VLAHRTWKNKFGGDPAIIGKKIVLNQRSYEVIGVMGSDFAWPNDAEIWVPIALPPARYLSPRYRYWESLDGVARLQPNVSLQQANALLAQRTQEHLATEEANGYAHSAQWGLFAVPLVEAVWGDLRKPLLLLWGAVAMVLLITCANLAGLQLARASDRRRELSIRIALGATRANVLRQAAVESAVITLLGAILSIVVVREAMPLLLLTAPESLRNGLNLRITGPVLWYAAALALSSLILSGVVPAFSTTKAKWSRFLQEGQIGTAGSSRQALRSGLVIAEIALATLLLAVSGLLLRSLQRLQTVDVGFETSGLLTAEIALQPGTYKSGAPLSQFVATVESQLSTANNISSAAVVGGGLPFSGSNASSSFEIVGRPTPPGSPGPHGNIREVTSRYFSTLRQPFIKGRPFSTADRFGTERVAIIDDMLEGRYWPDGDALGKQIDLGGDQKATIVGVVKHARGSSLESDTLEGFYFLSLLQQTDPSLQVVVRAQHGSPELLADEVKQTLHNVDSTQAVYGIKTMQQRVDESLLSRRFLVTLLSSFAAFALMLSALGLYGVISYSVKTRFREIGIRMALGAQKSDVLVKVLSEGAMLAVYGLVVGVLATMLTGRLISTMLFGVSLFNAETFTVTALLLFSTVLIASYLPARRAASIDPIVALRHE